MCGAEVSAREEPYRICRAGGDRCERRERPKGPTSSRAVTCAIAGTSERRGRSWGRGRRPACATTSLSGARRQWGGLWWCRLETRRGRRSRGFGSYERDPRDGVTGGARLDDTIGASEARERGRRDAEAATRALGKSADRAPAVPSVPVALASPPERHHFVVVEVPPSEEADRVGEDVLGSVDVLDSGAWAEGVHVERVVGVDGDFAGSLDPRRVRPTARIATPGARSVEDPVAGDQDRRARAAGGLGVEADASRAW